MIQMTTHTRILVATQPADFRKGLDAMIALCRQCLAEEPRSEALFAFINRNRTMVRVVRYDGTGFWLMTKRLSKGRFRGWPQPGQPACPMTARELSRLFKGQAPNGDDDFKNAA